MLAVQCNLDAAILVVTPTAVGVTTGGATKSPPTSLAASLQLVLKRAACSEPPVALPAL